MTITCPGCKTSYEIPVDVLADTKNVRCVRCHHNWQPNDNANLIADNAQISTRAPETSQAVSTPEHTRSSPKRADAYPAPLAEFLHFDIEPASEIKTDIGLVRPEPWKHYSPDQNDGPSPAAEVSILEDSNPSQPFKPSNRYSNLAAAALAMAVFGGGIAYKQSIIAAVPDMAAIYRLAGLETNTRGLKFINVETSTSTLEGIEQLIVRGEVENFTTGSIAVPKIRFSMRDKDEQEIYSWTAIADNETLSGGQTTIFKSSIKSPPNDAKDLKIHFTAIKDNKQETQ